ncbi:MAG: hypothetical protein BRD55_02855 [Bacteroidetes bacterium SW_9_63_38]|nr:MAG: hypothetical protein BRD55_02855 [Bacteroidetes bacterium SW_9_63_38]
MWIDAQLSPALAVWINRNYEGIEAKSVRAIGLRDADDQEIYQAAREAEVVMMSKDIGPETVKPLSPRHQSTDT